MKRIGIFYGSTTGNTEKIAQKIKLKLEPGLIDIYNVKNVNKHDIEKYENIILGSSTLEKGVMQSDFEYFLHNTLKTADLKGKKIAIFRTGDSSVYTDSFADSIGVIFDALKGKGVIFVGEFLIDGYKFESSLSMFGEKFIGLPLDDDSDYEQNKLRISIWTDLLKFDMN